MTFTEADLHRLSIKGGWIGDKPCLSASQLDTLLAKVKYPVPDDKRAQFKIWLNRLFAQYVEDLRIRAETLPRVGESGSRSLQGPSATVNRPQKLSTLVRRELGEIRRAILDSIHLMVQLSPSGRDAINTYFWRNRLVARTRVSRGRTFWETWERLSHAFLYLQLACERFDETGLDLPGSARSELARVSQGFDTLADKFEAACETTRDVLDASYDDPGFSSEWPVQPEGAIQDACRNALEWLALLRSIAERPRVEVKQGRDEAPQKQMVRGLAEIYWAKTDREPGRVYRVVETQRGDPIGETGDFLELARTLAGYARSALPESDPAGRPSLSRIVREVLAERRGTRGT